MKKLWLLVLIVLLASVLRFWGLGSNPPALTWDEAAWGYNAYSLGLSARDEFGRFLPLNYLESFGDFKPPVYAYLTILPVKVFGLNEFAVRFPSALFGVLTVLLSYFLVKEIFGRVRRPTVRGGHLPTSEEGLPRRCLTPPLIASFLLAISPWHIMLSRAAFEANVATFFLVSGVTSFLVGVRKKNWLLALSTVCFSLSFQTFNTARVMAPLLLLGLAVGFRKELWASKKQLAGSFLAGLIILAPAIPFFLTPQAKLRFREVNIFSDALVVKTANQEMLNDRIWLTSFLPEAKFTGLFSLVHNRRWGYARNFLRHYFDHFKPWFLFIKGDGNPKFSTQDVGELYLWELPFLVVGILFLFRRKQSLWWFVPYWLLAGIIPAATARETPHALRIETTLPTWQILTAIGIVEFWGYSGGRKFLMKNFLRIAFCVLLIANVIYFQHGYWRHYPTEFSGEWQYGYKPAVEFVQKVEGQYDEIWVTESLGRPYIYFLFYLKERPENFWQGARVEREALGFVTLKEFSKYHFAKELDFSRPRQVLYIDSPQNVPAKANVLKTFYLLNGEEVLKAFEV